MASFAFETIRKAEPLEFLNLLVSLDDKCLKSVGNSLEVRLDAPTLADSEKIRNKVLFLAKKGECRALCGLVSCALVEFSKKILGDKYENPSLPDLDDLTEQLIGNFGKFRTQVYFSGLIDSRVTATNLLKRFFDRDGPLVLNEPDPAPTARFFCKSIKPFTKQMRRQRRLQKRERHEQMRQQQLLARKPVKKEKPRPSAMMIQPTELVPAPHTTIVHEKRTHPHVILDEARTDDDLVGRIGTCFIRFSSKWTNAGKSRPVVIIAVGPNYFIVRPIYSHAKRGAGYFRAVILEDWLTAGLRQGSCVGDEQHIVRKKNLKITNKSLSRHDWNTVCLGEVN